MKRQGYLIEQIADPNNLRLAFWKARKGKDGKTCAEEFRASLDTNLIELRNELLCGEVQMGDYHYFKVYDPKERTICAAPFRERVLHHAIMNVCHPVFESFQTDDSYATRRGKGQYAALDKARAHTCRYKWFCKLDVRKFFDNVDHETLYDKICRKFKDPKLLTVFRTIIDSYSVTQGKGIPIGNLTSQYFANFYLGYADHYVRERLHVPAYVRYMDDMVLWHNDKSELLRISRELECYIASQLKMRLKPACVNTTEKGIPFLGYVLFPDKVRLNRNSKKRFKRKMKNYEAKLETGEWTERECARHIEPLVAFTRYAETLQLRRSLLKTSETDHKRVRTA
ncbi:RNA-directed DNA polymerase [Bacteroides sp. UBA939]|uniref:RNA-directed DNA polymerase n=1 Tax=Bacteroides sp. UBA939 TaxID=1946092 RepID=UPI0025C1DD9F|nr:RNA-directed DNA polymerase [Bacteroides sp. UBA939]